jgi:hypothetical protein
VTTPVAHGTPDWSEPAVATDVVFQPRVAVANDAGTIYGPFFVGFSPFVGVRIDAAGVGAGSFTFGFYADAGLTSILDAHEIGIQNNGRLSASLRSLGPWMIVTTLPSAATMSFTWALFSADREFVAQPSATANVLVSQVATPIGVGATVTTTPSRIWPGMAFVMSKIAAGTHEVFLRSITPAGALVTIFHGAYVAGLGARDLVPLTGHQVRMDVFNTSGGATNFDAYLVGVPRFVVLG